MENEGNHFRITLKKAQDLCSRDKLTKKSDPFCIITLGFQSVKSERIKKNLNPDWTDAKVFVQGKGDKVRIEVWDWDILPNKELLPDLNPRNPTLDPELYKHAGDSLGCVELQLDEIKEKKQITLVLVKRNEDDRDVSGSVTIEVEPYSC